VKDEVRRLNDEYGFNLSEAEIEQIAKQAEAARRLFQPLYEVDLTGVMPIMKIDKKERK
jgi:Asp-tRNA(Asn)/Glu-tRNA(Gln) amidotransferase C subunit